MQNLVTIPEWVSFPRMREILHQNVYSASFLGSTNAPQPRPRTDFHAQYVTRRGSAQGCGSLGLENKQKTFKPSYSRKSRHF